MLKTTTTVTTSAGDQYENFKALLNAIRIAYGPKIEKQNKIDFDEMFKNLSSTNEEDKRTGLRDLNKFLQECGLPRHGYFGLGPKAPITDCAILKRIYDGFSEDKKDKNLPAFLDDAYKEFQRFYNKQPDVITTCGDVQFEEDPKDSKIHIAVLGTNHVLAKVQLKCLEERLAIQGISKDKVCIHLLCKSGQNSVLPRFDQKLPAEDYFGEADEMYKVFWEGGFNNIEEHVVDGKYIGTKPTLEKFYQDCKGQLPKNLTFLCCPNTLDRQVNDIKLFLAENNVLQDKIQFLTFNYQQTAEYLKDILRDAESKEEQLRIRAFLEPKIVLSSFFAEIAKDLYAVLDIEERKSIPKEKKEQWFTNLNCPPISQIVTLAAMVGVATTAVVVSTAQQYLQNSGKDVGTSIPGR